MRRKKHKPKESSQICAKLMFCCYKGAGLAKPFVGVMQIHMIGRARSRGLKGDQVKRLKELEIEYDGYARLWS
ncbi:hypothetical protein [Sinorhizobium meliloti]|uniref:hypothetical protein n=1 Tax=Rhizobium meliloti TaxID=382 RepID=UPI0003DC0596|nr:hypothetical protein SMRU11_29145 [Sinorhizobium meliloti RU11/001]